MFFTIENDILICKYENETLIIEGWGTNWLRIRDTWLNKISEENWA